MIDKQSDDGISAELCEGKDSNRPRAPDIFWHMLRHGVLAAVMFYVVPWRLVVVSLIHRNLLQLVNGCKDLLLYIFDMRFMVDALFIVWKYNWQCHNMSTDKDILTKLLSPLLLSAGTTITVQHVFVIRLSLVSFCWLVQHYHMKYPFWLETNFRYL